MKIPGAKPYFEQDMAEILADLKTVLESGRMILGPFTKKFEENFRQYIGTNHAVAVSSCTAALEASLRFFDVREKEVIVPANGFIACPNSVVYAGGKPVFCDIEDETYNLDINSVLERINSKTRAIMAVHISGMPVTCMKELREICDDRKIALIEDCSHAHGAEINGKKVGSFGDAGCFSFYPTKIMTTGVGGMISTDNAELVDYVETLRHHGQNRERDKVLHFGNDWMIDELSAVLGIYQLKRLDENVEKRNKIAQAYMKGIDKMKGISYFKPGRGIRHAYYKFLAKLENSIDRNKLKDILRKQYNIEAFAVYPDPLHTEPIYNYLGFKKEDCPIASEALKHQLSLPIIVQMSKEEIDYTIESLGKSLNEWKNF